LNCVFYFATADGKGLDQQQQARDHMIYDINIRFCTKLQIKVSDLASNCVFYFATADGKESAT